MGPCNVPLILPGVGTGISPTSLIKLSDYGLLLTGAAKTNTNAEKGKCFCNSDLCEGRDRQTR